MQESVAIAFEERLKHRMQTLRVGPPLDKAIDMGAIVDQTQLQRIERYVEMGKAEGGVCWQSDVCCLQRVVFSHRHFLPVSSQPTLWLARRYLVLCW